MANDRKVALITGANKGIGYEIARQLAGHFGMTVLIGARDEQRGRDAADALGATGLDARAILLDVTDKATIAAAAQEIETEFGRLDVLVNNAGILLELPPPDELDVDILRRTYDTNVFGLFAVTIAMLPLLKRSSAPRIVNLSSGLGSLTQISNPDWRGGAFNYIAYNSSKTAVNALTVMLAAKYREAGIKVNAADPGYTATDMNRRQGTRTLEQGAAAAVHLATLPNNGPTGGYFDEDGPLPW